MANSEPREYELVYILQPEMDEQGVLSFNERVSQLVASQSGSVSTTELWGRRGLAYPIGKHFEGHYVLHRFTMPPEGAGEVDRLLRLNENVVRYLLIRTDE
ncbi:MAG TPA: 30S ribosomal protein S6 [Caldilineaceae bacterium]|nr:30S ribosomal protein S6 [Caldilineaceae bacterium]